MVKTIISIFFDSILAGIFLCVCCMLNLLMESAVTGAFLFSMGLFVIITFKLALFTGKAGYIAVKPLSHIGEVVLTFVANFVGCAIGGFLVNLTRFGPELAEKAAMLMETKMTDSPVSIFILSVLCGLLMFTAVHGNTMNKANGNYIGALFIVVLPIMVFILCGFNHSVADAAYFFISRCANMTSAPLYFILAVIGNAVGCMLVLILKKHSEEKIH